MIGEGFRRHASAECLVLFALCVIGVLATNARATGTDLGEPPNDGRHDGVVVMHRL